jgi:predicted glycoside hydrolase/deacetylase ChbG (UPF0249 family)
MKELIVNADDLGASRGTNRGILHAHRYGIVTSASLLVETAWSADGAALAAAAPALSVGLHLHLDGVPATQLTRAMERQLERFHELMGCAPTHVDTHHNAHEASHALLRVRRFAKRHSLPLRGHSTVRVCSEFYGRWNGETHPEQIGVAGLVELLTFQVHEGLTELVCHPGYVDPELRSSYDEERELEVRTLCDPALPALLDVLGIHLMGFRDLAGAVGVGGSV